MISSMDDVFKNGIATSGFELKQRMKDLLFCARFVVESSIFFFALLTGRIRQGVN